MCQFCQQGKELDSSIISLTCVVDDKEKQLCICYDAYSVDSSFDYDEVYIEINFCPFCGRKL